MPARCATSTRVARSPKSPDPTLCVERRENTGTAMPHPRHGDGNRKCPSLAMIRDGRESGPTHRFDGDGSETGGLDGMSPDTEPEPGAFRDDSRRPDSRPGASGCSFASGCSCHENGTSRVSPGFSFRSPYPDAAGVGAPSGLGNPGIEWAASGWLLEALSFSLSFRAPSPLASPSALSLHPSGTITRFAPDSKLECAPLFPSAFVSHLR
mmetsp:Transcript_6420/g.24192  ORF Transcript_6420/g.24192 Transcript_6420/m.24192 type:complete len:210 (+) Transcript_6420:2342-2971(+)